MTTSALIRESNSVEFKADLFPITVIKITVSTLSVIKSQLATTVAAAPSYFKGAPVVIDLAQLPQDESIDLPAVCTLIQAHDMKPVGIRGVDKTYDDHMASLGLAHMRSSQSNKTTATTPSLTSGTPGKTVKNSTTPSTSAAKKTHLITTPVRSGSQIYARGADLVITAAVNAGAECIADGNIHIYGPLRGKALAGASGDTSARIFCSALDAELIAIAGHYLTSEQIKSPQAIQNIIEISLKEKQLSIQSI